MLIWIPSSYKEDAIRGPNSASVASMHAANTTYPTSSALPVICWRPISSCPLSIEFMNIDSMNAVSIRYIETIIMNSNAVI